MSVQELIPNFQSGADFDDLHKEIMGKAQTADPSTTQGAKAPMIDSIEQLLRIAREEIDKSVLDRVEVDRYYLAGHRTFVDIAMPHAAGLLQTQTERQWRRKMQILIRAPAEQYGTRHYNAEWKLAEARVDSAYRGYKMDAGKYVETDADEPALNAKRYEHTERHLVFVMRYVDVSGRPALEFNEADGTPVTRRDNGADLSKQLAALLANREAGDTAALREMVLTLQAQLQVLTATIVDPAHVPTTTRTVAPTPPPLMDPVLAQIDAQIASDLKGRPKKTKG